MVYGIGVSLKIDQKTLDGNFVHFARVFIEMDLSRDLLDSLMIKRREHKFFIAIEYENI